ncbi:VOC family protein [Subtercola sp. YIM 133946]|uniref:VOC family protein n=1 Tax=Subtercola sp. YIM 133946 TaxID=3118909 RepID=UPI002F94EAF6
MKTFHTFLENDNIHHVRIAVSNLERSFAFWHDVFGYERDFDFPGPDGVVNWAIKSEGGGPSIVLWVDAARAADPPPYPLFSLSLPDEQAVYDLAAELDRLGLEHGELTTLGQAARVFAYDPDRNKIGCYVRHGYRRSAEDIRLRPLR